MMTAVVFRPFNDAWLAAYPGLERTLGDNPSSPWNNVIVGNTFDRCRCDMQFDRGVNSVTNRMTLSGNETISKSFMTGTK